MHEDEFLSLYILFLFHKSSLMCQIFQIDGVGVAERKKMIEGGFNFHIYEVISVKELIVKRKLIYHPKI